MEAKQARDEANQKEIDDLRVRDASDYNKLKIKLETDIQTLEQQLEDMRATYQLNTEKLEYNYRVLTERDMENSATLNQQKRKLSRLKDVLSSLIQKYTQTDAQQRHQNNELTEEYRRLTKQYKDLQKKCQHFEEHDQLKYAEVWKMHEEETAAQLEKILQADKIIHEQQLGLVWIPPRCDLRHVKIDRDAVHHGETLDTTTSSSSPLSSSSSSSSLPTNRRDGQDPPSHQHHHHHHYHDRHVSSTKLKWMLKMLVSEAGFLASDTHRTHHPHHETLDAIDSVQDDDAELVRADSILRSLGVQNDQDIERLLSYFFHDTHVHDKESQDRSPHPPFLSSDTTTTTASMMMLEKGREDDEENAGALAKRLGLKVSHENVLHVIQAFVKVTTSSYRHDHPHPHPHDCPSSFS